MSTVRYTRPDCPECGERARGQVEWVSGVAEFQLDDDGTFLDWTGETRIDWNTQIEHFEAQAMLRGEERKEKALLNCGAHEWVSPIEEVDA